MGKLISFLLGIVIIVLVIVFLFGKGAGFGGGKGIGNSEATTSSVTTADSDSASSSSTSSINDSQNILKISVTDNNYIYENRSVTLDEIITAVDTAGESSIVEITDDSASLQAYEKLLQQLDEHNIKYIEPIS